jgi:chloride channel 3/4/5
MASSSTDGISPTSQAESSSTQNKSDQILDDSDNDDPVSSYSRERALLSGDPLDDGADQIVSFKRKQKQSLVSTLPKSLPAFFNRRQASPIGGSRSGTPRPNSERTRGSSPPNLDANGYNLNGNLNHHKDGAPLDWYVEGPGRRVGYEDLTAIDWIFEYTKERQRQRVLYSSATGILGYGQKMLDASQVWIVLIVTGLAVGLIAAGIDIASEWLGDIKTGYCMAGNDGGRFYLNRYFCCWGYDELSQCQDWVPWSKALHITSTAGKWFMEYIFFIVYSVSHQKGTCSSAFQCLYLRSVGCICCLCKRFGKNLCNLCEAQWDTRDKDSSWWFCHSAFYGNLDFSD